MLNGIARVFPVCLALLLALATSPSAWAQWTNNRGYQLLQRVDDVLFGVDNLSLVILDRRYVAGTLVRINAQQPLPVRGTTQFVADCQKPLRFAAKPVDARVSSAPSPGIGRPLEGVQSSLGRPGERPLPGQLEFSDTKLLDGTWFAAEFACESTRQPGRASRLAKEMFERGGPPDMQTIYCELQPDGSLETRPAVEVRFSASANAVAVNRQWLSSGEVTEKEVRFGSNSKWRIDRQALDVRRIAASGEMLFSGTCDKRPPAAAPR